jgi:hypothetical protein
MVDDATTSSCLPVMPIQDEKLEEAPIDTNVPQQLHEEELIGKVVHIQVVQSVGDHHVSPNLHAFTIYLELIPTLRTRLQRFDEC